MSNNNKYLQKMKKERKIIENIKTDNLYNTNREGLLVDGECKSTWDTTVSKQKQVKTGTKICLPYIWAHTDKGLTPVTDIEIKLDSDCSLVDALCQVEKKATEFVQSHGASDIRHYYIEGISKDFLKNKITFNLGT